MLLKTFFDEDCMADATADALAGTFLDRSAFNLLLEHEDATLYKPDGTLLLKFLKGRLSGNARREAYVALHDAARPTNNRGVAAGAERHYAILKDGTVSSTAQTAQVMSGVAGYFDRYPRIPYCRTTAYTAEDAGRFALAYPLVREVSELFRNHVPSRWAAQNAQIQKTHVDFRIADSVFTTITINKNWQTAVHKDAGDLPEGFGVLTVLERGAFDGGYLVLPKFRVAVRLREGDLLLYDVHEWHGNTPFVTAEFDFVRLGLVFYYRRKMAQCLSAAEELERAKRLAINNPTEEN
jgi:hypothetical protein